MKIIKKIVNIILIFAVIQAVGMVFTTNTTNASFFENVVKRNKDFQSMEDGNAEKILENNTGFSDAINDIYQTLRWIAAGAIFAYIGYTFIAMSMHETGDKIAENKTKMTVLLILALFFIFFEQIRDFIVNLITNLQGLD